MWPPAGTGPSRGPWNPHLPPQADPNSSSSAPDCPSPSPRTLGARPVPEAQGCPWQQVQPPTASSQQCSLIFYMQTPQQGQGAPPHPIQCRFCPHTPRPSSLPLPGSLTPHPMRPKGACALASPAGCGSLRQADWQFGGLLGPPCGHMPTATHKVTCTHARPRCVAMSPPSCPEQPCLPWGMGGGWSLTSVCWGRQESGSWRVGQTREAWPAAPSLGPCRRSL